ncbi:MAG: TIGR03862 family flavoprotein, partial [Betaproteobacteria bacterium]
METMKTAAVIGGGPAGLMAAEVLAGSGARVHVYDAMPSVGRKFLLAGKGGLNLTHSEGADAFAGRYGDRQRQIQALLQGFGAAQLRAWVHGLGVQTFVGSSGRVFPKDMKAAPLLRAWLHRLRSQGVQFHMRHRWTGWDAKRSLHFESPQGARMVHADAVVLALGGGSWPQLGSDGAWVPLLQQRGVAVAALQASNCGFDVGTPQRKGWSEVFASRFAGQPFKSVAIDCSNALGESFSRRGEFVATRTGVEGSLVYAASSLLRDEIARSGSASLRLDLMPDWSIERVQAEVSHARGSRSLSSHLKSRLGLDGIKASVLYEVLSKETMHDPVALSTAIKSLPIRLLSARPIEEAIS